MIGSILIGVGLTSFLHNRQHLQPRVKIFEKLYLYLERPAPYAIFVISILILVITPAAADTFLVAWNDLNVSQYARIISAIFVSSVLSGYFVLSIMGLRQSFDRTTSFVMSVLIGIGVTIIIGTIHKECILIVHFALFTTSAVLEALRRQEPLVRSMLSIKEPSASIWVTVLGIILLALFGVYVFNFQNFQLYLGPDTWRHLGWALLQLKGVPQIPLYPRFARIYLASVLELSNAPIINTIMFLSVINLTLIPAFYIMARELLSNIHPKATLVALVVWAAIGGLSGLIVFTSLVDKGVDFVAVLKELEKGSYLDVGRPFGYYLIISGVEKFPEAINLVSFFVLLSIWKSNVLKDRPLHAVIIVALTSFIGFLFYPTGLIIISALSVIYSMLFDGSPTAKDKRFILGLVIGSMAVTLTELTYLTFVRSYAVAHQFWTPHTSFTIVTSLLLCLSLVLIRLSEKYRPKFSALARRCVAHLTRSRLTLITLGVLATYFMGLALWSQFHTQFDLGMVSQYWDVPWYFYPLRFGIAGILGLLGILILLRRNHIANEVRFIVFATLFILVMAKSGTIINQHLNFSILFEYRILTYLWVFIALLAAIGLVTISSFIGQMAVHLEFKFPRRSIKWVLCQKTITRIFVPVLVGILLIAGIPSTLLTLSFWRTQEANITPEELAVANFLRMNEPSVDWNIVISNSPRSYQILQAFSGIPIDLFYEYRGEVFFQAKGTEMPLITLNSICETSQAKYLLLTNGLKPQNGTFVCSFLLPNLPVLYHNDKFVLFSLPNLVPPVPKSNMALVTSSLENGYLASTILSSLGFKYTTFLDNDANVFRNSKVIVVPYDPLTSNNVEYSRQTWNLSTAPHMILDGADHLGNWLVTAVPYGSKEPANDTLSILDAGEGDDVLYNWTIDMSKQGWHWITLHSDQSPWNLTNVEFLELSLVGDGSRNPLSITIYDTNGGWRQYRQGPIVWTGETLIAIDLNDFDSQSKPDLDLSKVKRITVEYYVPGPYNATSKITFSPFMTIMDARADSIVAGEVEATMGRFLDLQLRPRVEGSSKGVFELRLEKNVNATNFRYLLIRMMIASAPLDSKDTYLQISLLDDVTNKWTKVGRIGLVNATVNVPPSNWVTIVLDSNAANQTSLQKVSKIKFELNTPSGENDFRVFIDSIMFSDEVRAPSNSYLLGEPLWLAWNNFSRWIEGGGIMIVLKTQPEKGFASEIMSLSDAGSIRYSTGDGNGPYWLERAWGNGTVVLMDLLSLRSNTRELLAGSNLGLLHELFDVLTLDLPTYDLKPEDNVITYKTTFYSAELNGNITIQTPSLLPTGPMEIELLEYKSELSDAIFIHKPDSVTIEADVPLTYTLETETALIRAGSGFYSQVQAGNGSRIVIATENNKIMKIITMVNGSQVQLETNKIVITSAGKLDAFLRTPNVSVSGVAQLYYSFFDRDLHDIIPTQGATVRFVGTYNMKVDYSDTYNLARDVSFTQVQEVKSP